MRLDHLLSKEKLLIGVLMNGVPKKLYNFLGYEAARCLILRDPKSPKSYKTFGAIRDGVPKKSKTFWGTKRWGLQKVEEFLGLRRSGGVAQLGEHLPCKQGVSGSNPLISTINKKKAPRNQKIFWGNKRWAYSSGGKSARLISVRSVVRVHLGPP